METVGLFEAKAKLSEICERVNSSGVAVLVTKRGVPFVKITPFENPEEGSSTIWEVREAFVKKYGVPDQDITLPPRKSEKIKNPFKD